MPSIKIDLHDVPIERQFPLHYIRLASFLGELSDCATQLTHKERFSGTPITEKTDRERRRRVAGRNQGGQGKYILLDADKIQSSRSIGSELYLPARLRTGADEHRAPMGIVVAIPTHPLVHSLAEQGKVDTHFREQSLGSDCVRLRYISDQSGEKVTARYGCLPRSLDGNLLRTIQCPGQSGLYDAPLRPAA